jgi:energy-coupling factor transporter ATP-binding protein EcfA2
LDGTAEDALRVLSEGHLRCLGLSILLAKNIHDAHNVIIFDDVVNAIDDEHRTGIINELFSNNLLSEKQMILTTHGEDFIKRLENQLLSKGLNKKLTRYDFIRNHDSREVLIEPDLNRHYLVKAENNFKKGLIKDGLMECRRSLEELAPRLWKKMKAEGLDPALTVKLRAPSTAPDLYSLIDGLTCYIAEIEKKPGITNFSEHRQCLMKVKDVSKKNQVTWNLLNKGTHEEDRDEEFDENQANELFELCLEFEGWQIQLRSA